MKESDFLKKVEQFLKAEGCYYIKYWGGGQFTRAGIPDLLVCCNGLFLGVELKAENGKPSKLQLWNIDEIRKAGGVALVLYPNQYDEFKHMVELILSGNVNSPKIQYKFDRRENK